jgi:bifunctional non-homologous end joining protein LigD
MVTGERLGSRRGVFFAPRLPIMKAVEPMYASVGSEMPTGSEWTFEQKYDGMRIIAVATTSAVQLVTRNGRDKRAQFPELVEALRRLARAKRKTLMLDGEIVALVRGKAGPFQALQPRLHLSDPAAVAEMLAKVPSAFMLFDMMYDGATRLLRRPLDERREHLERLLDGGSEPKLRVSPRSSRGAAMLQRARRGGWEGLIAKRRDSLYVPGARTRDWLKLKLQHRAEFIVGGYTEPRRSREHIGALLLGYFDAKGKLCYVGRAGGGFDRDSLKAMLQRLSKIERTASPFTDLVRKNEPVHWVKPVTVVEVKFAEWTTDGKLRQPIFLGVRDDKRARDVHKERESVQEWGMAGTTRTAGTARTAGTTRTAGTARTAGTPRTAGTTRKAATARTAGTTRKAATTRRAGGSKGGIGAEIIRQLDEIQTSGGDGMLEFGRGKTLKVTSLDKIYYPDAGVTKGDVMRYYASVSPVLLPIIADRPLVLKRYPDGIAGPSFFQQNAGANVPKGVRTARVATGDGARAARIIGGDLLTLLYTVQIGTIAVHAWQSRVTSPVYADTSTIDLDPGDDVTFKDVVTLAKQLKVELDRQRLHSAIKTSGSSGLHVVIPLPPQTVFADAARLAEQIAERVVEEHPDRATVERSLKARPAGTIYVDAQQNAKGKSVVAAYSLRERPEATVSAPLDWRELRSTLQLESFTIDTISARLRSRGDLWGAAISRRNTRRAIDQVLNEA